MRASKEYRRWINKMRKRFGKKNGVIYSGLLDAPVRWIEDDKSKKNYKRNKL